MSCYILFLRKRPARAYPVRAWVRPGLDRAGQKRPRAARSLRNKMQCNSIYFSSSCSERATASISESSTTSDLSSVLQPQRKFGVCVAAKRVFRGMQQQRLLPQSVSDFYPGLTIYAYICVLRPRSSFGQPSIDGARPIVVRCHLFDEPKHNQVSDHSWDFVLMDCSTRPLYSKGQFSFGSGSFFVPNDG